MNSSPAPSTSRLRLAVMAPRDPEEPGRSATMLELFFDLVFVVAVSRAAIELHHEFAEGHLVEGLMSYGLVFFAIWWAWMNFTWFATSFGIDDWLYRVLTFVQMAGVLVLSAGIEPAFADGDYTLLVAAYVVMRVAMVAQWLRASRQAGEHRRTTQVYAAGIATTQVAWLAMLAVPEATRGYLIVLLILAELAVPLLAERQGPTTPWHPHHITERYGLFTIIVLGEGLLASGNAVIEALHDDEALAGLVAISVLSLVVTAALWWVYFWPPHHEAIQGLGASLKYGYSHYLVFAAAGAFSAGVEVQIDVLTHHSDLGDVTAALTVGVPVAIFMLVVWWIGIREHADPLVNGAVLAATGLVLVVCLLPQPLVFTAVVLVLLIAVLVARQPLSNRSAVR